MAGPEALKADPVTEKIPVVMVSFVADANISAAMGAADAVPKPVDWPKLKEVIERLRDRGGDVQVVDDDLDMRHRLHSVLERGGWTVSEAGDGAEALDKVTHRPPHLILLDLTMPVMDGFSFLHRLRQTAGCADIPVVVFSARDITKDERERLNSADRILKNGETSMRTSRWSCGSWTESLRKERLQCQAEPTLKNAVLISGFNSARA